MSITENIQRVGNFTSSNAWKLMQTGTDKKSFGEKALSYIHEKRQERKLGRSIHLEKLTRPKLWGKFLEMRVHTMLGIKYVTQSDVTIVHPRYPYWAGSPDTMINRERVVGDIKCYEPLKFSNYVDCLSTGDIEKFRKEFKEEYWQLVSNSHILGFTHIEAIAYLPYKKELPDIRLMAYNYDAPDQFRYKFIHEAEDCELAYQADDSQYKNLNVFRFEVPKEDKDRLEQNIIRAEKLLAA